MQTKPLRIRSTNINYTLGHSLPVAHVFQIMTSLFKPIKLIQEFFYKWSNFCNTKYNFTNQRKKIKSTKNMRYW